MPAAAPGLIGILSAAMPLDPHPVFKSFIEAALKEKKLFFPEPEAEAVEVVDNSENVRWLGQQGQVGVK